MNRKESLYAVIGGITGAVLTMVVCSVMPIRAQNGDATFGEITCRGLRAVDAKGDTRIWLVPGADTVWVFGEKGGGVILDVNDHGGRVQIYGRGGRSDRERQATLGIDEHGGYVGIYGKGSQKAHAVMSVNDYGNGTVSTWDKNGYRLATLK